ncbi:MAG: hypothetical protein JRH13_12765, partial [Deltaproteobacteria bacterium]|nr:hypothetical protein [Deltaproteobacteria bacterium]
MNKKGILFLFIFFLPLLVLTVPCNPEEAVPCNPEEGDSFEQFHRKYKSLEPREGSSAGTDYLIGQTALATFYTTKMLNLIHEQNRQLLEKYDEAIEKYDLMIEQNKKIIELL